MLSKYGNITYPYWIDGAAEFIGKQRRKNNNELYEEVPSKKRGEWDSSVHPLGVKGELIAATYLDEKGISYNLSELLGSNPIVDADIIINDKRVDIKTIRPDGWDLLVTVSSHKNIDKNIDSYFFIQILDECNSRYWVFKHEEVSKWRKKMCRAYNYYKPINEINL